MSRQKAGAEEQLTLFTIDQTRERWRWVHAAIANAKEANRMATLLREEAPVNPRPVLRRVR